MSEEIIFDDELENEEQAYIIKLVSGELLIAYVGIEDLEDLEFLTKFAITMFAKLEFYRDNEDKPVVYFDQWIPGYDKYTIVLEKKHIMLIDYAPDYLDELFLDYVSSKLEKEMKNNELIDEDMPPHDKKLLH